MRRPPLCAMGGPPGRGRARPGQPSHGTRRELLRRVLWAHDGRIEMTTLLGRAFEQFQSDPHGIVHWASGAAPREFGALAPLVIEHARTGDEVGIEIMGAAAAHVDALAARLIALGVERIAL